jgi:hypothetical protein
MLVNQGVIDMPENGQISAEQSGTFGRVLGPAETARRLAETLDIEAPAARPGRLTAEAISAEMRAENTPAAVNIEQLAEAYPPESFVEVGDFGFNLTKVLYDETDDRHICVGYVRDEDSHISPRLFYRSRSEGEWRAVPSVNPNGRFSKGETVKGGYVRETRVVDDLGTALYAAELKPTVVPHDEMEALHNRFKTAQLGADRAKLYKAVTKEQILDDDLQDDLKRFEPGAGFYGVDLDDDIDARDYFADINLPDEIFPDFDRVENTRVTQHGLLGEITTESFGMKGNPDFIWHFSHDNSGRVWMSGVTPREQKPNSYGVDSGVVVMGLLDNKPLEYLDQIGGLEYSNLHEDYIPVSDPRFNGYADITPLLDNLEVIQAYRHARNVQRTESKL